MTQSAERQTNIKSSKSVHNELTIRIVVVVVENGSVVVRIYSVFIIVVVIRIIRIVLVVVLILILVEVVVPIRIFRGKETEKAEE